MLRMWTLPCVACLVGCAIAPASAQAPALDVKTGLWEVSSTSSSAGVPKMPAVPQMPPEVLAQMPPEQRARIESAMKAARGQTGGTQVHQFCLTRDSLRRGPSFGAETSPSCRQTTDVHSRTRWEMRLTCDEGGGRQTVQVRYQAPRPDIMNGTVEIVINDGGRQMTMKRVMRGRWLASDCGDVKPE